jgi:hypothetical protein
MQFVVVMTAAVADLLLTVEMLLAIIVSIAGSNVVGNPADISVKR